MNQKNRNQKSKKKPRPSQAKPADTKVEGIISVHPRGFGFVSTDQEKDVFIPPPHVNTALSADRVQVRIESEDERGPVGKVEKIIERGHTEIIGVLAIDIHTDEPAIRPLRRDLPEFIPLDLTPPVKEKGQKQGKTISQKPEEGDWIAVQLVFPRKSSQELRAGFLRVIAKPGTIAADLDAIVAEFGLLPPYSMSENRRAAAVKPVSIERERIEPSAVIVTIDPEDAKDFDDAVSLHPGPTAETMVAGVHIADVAAYIEPGSELDQAAAQRGFTAYLPGRTLHMLPPALAAEQCSLSEGVENLAHSVFLTIDCNTGEVLDSRRCHSRLTVTKRLSFEQVQALIDGESPTAIPENVASAVLSLHHLAATMRRHRAKSEQFLQLETREVRIVCDESAARITGLKRMTASAADHLVEEFMLAANVATAEELRRRELGALYRIHPEPKPVDIEEFVKWTREIGLGRSTGRLDSRKSVNNFLSRIKQRHDAEIVTSMFLRTLSRATYSAAPGLHYGLGKESYCHFTSPIRRYSDLLVHQQLWAADQGKNGRSHEECTRTAKLCTNLEKNNDDANFAALDRLKIRYIQELRMQGERLIYEGIVSRITGEGLLVFLPDLGIFGTMPKKAVPRKSSGKVWKSGNLVYVKVHKANPVRGQLIVAPAGS